MAGTKTATRKIHRSSERIPMHARLRLRTEDGTPTAPLARCTNVSLGGIRAIAAQGLSPGTRIQVDLQLPNGRHFHTQGRIAWLLTTLRPSLLSTPTGRDDDAVFGITFEDASPQDLLPIARLFAVREAERRRARRIRRLHTLRIHA